jgi:hypothetical protein
MDRFGSLPSVSGRRQVHRFAVLNVAPPLTERSNDAWGSIWYVGCSCGGECVRDDPECLAASLTIADVRAGTGGGRAVGGRPADRLVRPYQSMPASRPTRRLRTRGAVRRRRQDRRRRNGDPRRPFRGGSYRARRSAPMKPPRRRHANLSKAKANLVRSSRRSNMESHIPRTPRR